MQATQGRVLIKVDLEQKNYQTFSDGTVIRLEREFNNLDRKYTQQIMGECVDEDNFIPKGSLVLFHHNSTHDSNKIFNHEKLSGEALDSSIKLFSVPENECFLWKKPDCDSWNVMKNFCTALRVFEPYSGILEGIEPTKVPDVLYLLDGEYQGQVVHTVKAADYEMTFRNEKGVDQKIIRCRHFEDEDNDREEIIALRNDLTQKLKDGKLLIGFSEKDCVTLSHYLKNKI